MYVTLIKSDTEQLHSTFLDLIEICDSYDQLGKLAVICNHLYCSGSQAHTEVFKALEKTAIHIKGRHLGAPPAPTHPAPHWDNRPPRTCPCCGYQKCNCEPPY